MLLGRGGNNNKYPGNEQLRIFARNSARQYSLSGKLHISELSRTLVTRVRQLDPPGRFLKQNQTTKVWVDVGDITAREKTSQELRDAVRSLPRDYPYDARSSLSKKANRTSRTFKDRPRKRVDNQISTKSYYTEPLCQKGSYYTEPLCQNGNTSIIASSAVPTASGHNRLKRCTTSVLCLSDYQQKKQKPEPLCQNGNSSIIARSAIMLNTKNSINPTSVLRGAPQVSNVCQTITKNNKEKIVQVPLFHGNPHQDMAELRDPLLHMYLQPTMRLSLINSVEPRVVKNLEQTTQVLK